MAVCVTRTSRPQLTYLGMELHWTPNFPHGNRRTICHPIRIANATFRRSVQVFKLSNSSKDHPQPDRLEQITYSCNQKIQLAHLKVKK